MRITYIAQEAPAGLAHAVLTAEPFLGADPFVMYLGDNLLQGGIDHLVEEFRASAPDALILLTPVPDPEHYGVAELDGDRVVRWPRSRGAEDQPRAGRRLHVHRADPRRRARDRSLARGELEITDAIQYLVDRGHRVEPHVVQGWWKDTGRLEDMLEANRLVLDTIADRSTASWSTRSATAAWSSSRRPARALDRPRAGGHRRGRAPHRRLRRAYTAIGEDCVIERAEVEHSILLAGSSVATSTGAWSPRCSAATSTSAQRRAAARVPLHGRRQLGDRDPLASSLGV